MTTNEIITLIISGSAFALSGVSIYLSFFYKKISAIGNLIVYKTDFDEHGSVDCVFSFSNNGNKEILLRSVDIDLINWEEGELVPEISSSQLPAVIKSGGVSLVELSIPKYFCEALSHKQKEFSLNFNVISSDGTQYSASLTLRPMVIDEGGSIGFLQESLEKPFLLKRDSNDAHEPRLD